MSTSEGEDRRGIRVTVDASGHVFLLNDPAEDMCSVEDVPTEGAFGGGGSGGVFVGRGARRAEASGTLPLPAGAEGDDRVGDVATRRMSDPLPPLVALPPALLDAVLSFLDGRSLARVRVPVPLCETRRAHPSRGFTCCARTLACGSSRWTLPTLRFTARARCSTSRCT
jgi:hypothetical protein